MDVWQIVPCGQDDGHVELVEEYGVSGAEIDLIAGAPADVLTELAIQREAELVVVGVPQRRGRLAAVVGSTAEGVAAEAACDVLLVPARSG